ncbi:aldose 1-epimerase family protein [Terrabacter aerolatus]|uniref:Aldose 1-epimerase n=1 Tax=Terrabacter aerolatus TaxID=422442 RepID=A0A512D411_9MICO|nr:aldose 1-epimerase family protein [Terrabacter aerolatus]GEO31187.1 aldose 1-epimerase [Terrabacter aerolatus]
MSTLSPASPAGPATALPTGQQWTIGHGPFAATVVEVGGGLRTLSRDGIDVVAGYAADETCASGRGQQLMPWPNRIRDGRYSFGGTEHQLSVTEVPRGNASHGLVRWVGWELVELGDDRLTVGLRLHPQPGWDHVLDLRTTYRLDDSGLVVTTSARNVGPTEAPFGYGAHPYLAIGDTLLPDVDLRIPAASWVEVDDRLLPAATHPVEGSAFDFRSPHAVGEARLDTAYTDVVRDDDGLWRCTVTAADRATTLWADASFGWLQVFTAIAEDRKGEVGIAVEPMSCPADAFNSGEGLVVLAPGEQWTGTWGISPA